MLLALAACTMGAEQEQQALSQPGTAVATNASPRKLLWDWKPYHDKDWETRKTFPESKCYALIDEAKYHGCDHHGDYHWIACCDYEGKCVYDYAYYANYENFKVYCKPGLYAACCRMDHSG